MTITYLGRIGVSLMLRYHKTHQWAKVNEHVCSFTQILGCHFLLHIRHGAENVLKSFVGVIASSHKRKS